MMNAQAKSVSLLAQHLLRLSVTGCRNNVHRTFSTTLAAEYRDRKVQPKWQHVSSRTHRWVEPKSLEELYGNTTEPVPVPRTGGRGPNGRIWQFRRGGGFRKYARLVDFVRGGPSSGDPLEERIIEFTGDDIQTAKLALVAKGERKRWIIATENMQLGDLVKSTTDTTISSLKGWKEGDSMPLKCIPRGTNICCVEKHPGAGGTAVSNGGSVAMVIRHVGDQVVVKLPSGHEMMVSDECTAVLGRPVRYKPKVKLRKAGESRWLGIRPQSGLWHAKDGRFGRKTNRRKKLQEFGKTPPVARPLKRLVFEGTYNFG